MNNIFEKNIQALVTKNNELAEKLIKHVLSDVPQLTNENGVYNLVYKGVLLHHPLNPLGEAQEIFSMAENTPVTIHLVYGIGLGYLFQVASANSTGTVILYEPDLNILKIAFSLVDFSNDILKKNVFISDTIQKTGEYLHKHSNTKNLPLMLSTKNYRELNASKFNEMVEELQRMVGSYNLDLKYTQEKFFQLVKNILTNIPNLVKEPPLSAIKDFYKGKTAVVVSAGPTLDRNIETIKKYRENIVLIVVGTAMKTLAEHDIRPDFLCIIETYDSSKQISGIDLSEVNFVTEPFSNINLRKFNFRQVFSHISSNLPVNSLWSNLINENNEEYLSKGTVSYTALNTARILGCSKIVLVGQDLAYIDGQCYSKDSAYKDLECRFNEMNEKWEIVAKNFEEFANALSNLPDFEQRKAAANRRLENLNKSLYYVKGINGDMIPTESVYAAFIKPLSEFTDMFNDREYINTSLAGAQIDGFKNMSLEDALTNSESIENRNIVFDYKFDVESMRTKLQYEANVLKQTLTVFEEGKKALKALNTDFKRYKTASVEVLKGLKKVSTIFLNLTKNSADTMFDFITAAEKINVDYEMKMSRNFDTKAIALLISKFSDYFEHGNTKVNSVIELIEKIAGEI